MYEILYSKEYIKKTFIKLEVSPFYNLYSTKPIGYCVIGYKSEYQHDFDRLIRQNFKKEEEAYKAMMTLR